MREGDRGVCEGGRGECVREGDWGVFEKEVEGGI